MLNNQLLLSKDERSFLINLENNFVGLVFPTSNIFNTTDIEVISVERLSENKLSIALIVNKGIKDG